MVHTEITIGVNRTAEADPLQETGRDWPDHREQGTLPPVIIMNLYHSGLAIARDLQGTGIRVLGLCSDKQAPGSHTKSCEVRIAPDSQNEPEKLLEYFDELSADFSGGVIFPTRDGDVAFLDRYREELSGRFRLAIPTHECLINVVQKDVLAQIAESVDVPVPRTMKICSVNDLKLVAQRIGFPCVVKPVSALDWRKGGNWQEVGCRKAFQVSTQEELELEYSQIEHVTPMVLVQEWIAGATSRIGILGGYVGPDAELVSFFTARKMLQSPDDFGTGCIVESEPVDGLLELSRRLFKAVNYRGMAEVEFKWDDRAKAYKLIEINTRHWDQHELASASGINLTQVAYLDVIGKRPRSVRKVTQKAKWIAEDALILHSLRAIYHRQMTIREIVGSIRGKRIYGLFSWKDPRPFLFSMLMLGSVLFKQVLVLLRGESSNA